MGGPVLARTANMVVKRYCALLAIAGAVACGGESGGGSGSASGNSGGPKGAPSGADQGSAARALGPIAGTLGAQGGSTNRLFGAVADAGPAKCDTSNCSGFNEQCDCTGYCDGRFVEAACNPAPGGVTCDCKVNGKVVGTCSANADGIDACHPATGCCAPLFGK